MAAGHAASHPNAATVGRPVAATSLARQLRNAGHSPASTSSPPSPVGGFRYTYDGGNGRYPLLWLGRKVR